MGDAALSAGAARCSVSALPALAAALAWRIRRGSERLAAEWRRPERTGRPERGLASHGGRRRGGTAAPPRSFVLLTASYTLQGYVGYIFVFWFYLYLVQERHFDLLRGAFLGSLPWLLTIVSVPLGGLAVGPARAARRGPVAAAASCPLVGLVGAGVVHRDRRRTPSTPTSAALSLAARDRRW